MPTEISDWNDLDNVRNDLTGDYVLVNDLDSGTDGYAGIGDDFEKFSASGFAEDPFSGTFDGGGFAIKDFVLGDYGGERGNGLFGGVGDGGLVENLSISGVVDLIGFSGDPVYAGGLAGTVGASGTGTIQNCVAHVDVTSDDEFVGGLVGQNFETVTDSYATGSVEGDNQVAGLVGRNDDTIQTSYAVGLVTGNEDVGGLCTDPFDNGTVTDSYWDTEATGQDTSGRDDGTEGGTGLTTAEMQGSEAETNMDGFDFANVWSLVEEEETPEIDGLVPEEDGYPILLSADLENQLDAQNILLVTSFVLTVETNPATDISAFGATLNGELVELDAEATDADVFFEFGETVGQNQTPTQTLTEPATFDELIDELDANTEYEFRAVAEAQDEENETFTDEGDILTFDTEIVTVDGTITLDETAAENADVFVHNLTQDTFEGRLSTDTNGEYSVDLPDANREDTVAVAVDFADGLERYGRLITTVLE